VVGNAHDRYLVQGSEFMLKDVISVLLAVALLVGCATTSDETRTKTEGTALGAGAGAVAGALLGFATGGKKGAIIGAGTGVAAGGAAGYLYGTHVANRKKAFATTEAYLDALIKNAQAVNDRTDALRQEIAQLETETIQLVQRYNQRTIQRGQLTRQEQILKKKVEEGQEQLKILQVEIDNQRQALAKENQAQMKSGQTTQLLNDLQAEITRLERNKAELEKGVTGLATMPIRPSA